MKYVSKRIMDQKKEGKKEVKKVLQLKVSHHVSCRFTELYVEELENDADLRILVSDYLRGLNLQKNVISGIIK